MTATYAITLRRTQKMDYKGDKEDKIDLNWRLTYDVEVGGVPAVDVDVIDVLNCTDTSTGFILPRANRTMYSKGGNIIPYLICRSVGANQNADNLSRWTVDTSWEGQYEGGNPEPEAKPASVTDISPKVVTELGEMERVLYGDFSDQVDGQEKKCIRSPSKSWYDEPSVERIATFKRTIQQYESSVTYEDARNRRFKVNKNPYIISGVVYPRYTWLIEDVKWTNVQVQTTGGEVTAALMTYELLYNPTVDYKGTAIGWKNDRVLIDTHYLDIIGPDTSPVGGPPPKVRRTEFRDSALGLQNHGYITSLGYKRDSQTGRPDSIQFETYRDINFSLFLQI